MNAVNAINRTASSHDLIVPTQLTGCQIKHQNAQVKFISPERFSPLFMTLRWFEKRLAIVQTHDR
ncbi:MAG: hypothetical protein HC795_06160 [Coleofasciculaceae cyanobacterium RL_1_1]|nr:hypothetical protein [Coleofasciculaceae cyanobacterium RL_1_1]